MNFKIGFYRLRSGHIYIVVRDAVNDVTYSRRSVYTRVVMTLLLHDVIHWKTATSYDNIGLLH